MVTDDPPARQLQRNVLPSYLANQRWFAAKGTPIISVSLQPWAELPSPEGGSHLLAAAELKLPGGETQCYFMPLAVDWGESYLKLGSPQSVHTLAKVRRGPRLGALIDAATEPQFARALLHRLQYGNEQADEGNVRYETTERLKEIGIPVVEESRRPTTEQSNVSVVLGREVLLKIYRRLQRGIQPEIEVSRFLTKAGFANTPAYLGSVWHHPPNTEPAAMAVAFKFISNQGNGWDVLVDALDRHLEEQEVAGGILQAEHGGIQHRLSLDLVRTIGQRTAEMHCAFASKTPDRAFRAEPITDKDVQRWTTHVLRQAKRAFAALKRVRATLPNSDETAALIDALFVRQRETMTRIQGYAKQTRSGLKMRHHGDYHLGQVLVAQNDVYVIDFEGEPLRSIKERRAKTDPIRDVAGMLRSFDYAAETALQRSVERGLARRELIASFAFGWRNAVQESFLSAYRETLAGCTDWPIPVDDAVARLDLFLLEKAFYEVSYEAGNRPAWVGIPVRGAVQLLD
jgi:maltose alpha-D-glucosyltransferase/alpha-amylase